MLLTFSMESYFFKNNMYLFKGEIWKFLKAFFAQVCTKIVRTFSVALAVPQLGKEREFSAQLTGQNHPQIPICLPSLLYISCASPFTENFLHTTNVHFRFLRAPFSFRLSNFFTSVSLALTMDSERSLQQDQKICVVYDIILCFELLLTKKGIAGSANVKVPDECRDACIYWQSFRGPREILPCWPKSSIGIVLEKFKLFIESSRMWLLIFS